MVQTNATATGVAIIGKMAQKIPKDRFAEFINWLYPLLGADDQENMVRIMRQAFALAVTRPFPMRHRAQERTETFQVLRFSR
jgi:hypothetical protein